MLNNVIQKEHELICSGCGCVLGQIEEFQGEKSERTGIPHSVNTYILGSALQDKKGRTEQQRVQERVIRYLDSIIRKYGLPQRLVYETFDQLKKKNRGFYSEKEPIKQLMKILEKDENYLYIHKYRLLKTRYEKEFNY